MKGSKIHSSKGFAAVTVLVISLLGGLIVFDTVQENINQERMAGNYSKEINAHLQAENGLAASYNALNDNSSLNSESMMTLLNDAQNDTGAHRYSLEPWVAGTSTEISTDGSGDDSDETIVETIVSTVFGGTSNTETSSASTSNASNAILIESKGFHYDGQYEMRGSISLAASSGNSVFTGAITTCDGAILGGSGTIDSYDSSEGSYDAANPGSNGDISVLNEYASGLTLSGGSPISGSASINGDLNISGSGSIAGDAHVSGSINLGSSGSIDGNAQATGSVTNSYSPITMDSISANGDVTILNSYDGPISYSGDLNYPDYGNVSNATYYDTGQVAAVGTETCDILGLASEFESGDIGNLETANSTTIDFSSAGDNNAFDYIFTSNGLESYIAGGSSSLINTQIDTESQDITFLDNDISTYIMSINDFSHGNTITIESGNDVILYLQGDTVISDKIYVEDGATLTIITEGTFKTTQDGGVYALDSDGNTANSSVNSNGDNSFLLYSGYDSSSNSDYGITLNGASDMFLTAYAPDASMQITASGNIYGSLRSDYLTVSGGAGIHYDEEIAATNVGGTGSTTSTPKITRWF